MKLTRRHALLGLTGLGASSCATPRKMEAFTSPAEPLSGVFAHGVASGDPKNESVILWTRITPPENASASTASVAWEVANDPEFGSIVQSGQSNTGAARDWTVKVDVANLTPGSTYFYRFKSADATSPTGRTKTLPRGALNSAKFAVVSCSNYPFGYFNVYDHISRQNDLDAVIHLGDYIYEYGPDGYGAEVGERLGRPHAPAKEIVSLSEYRTRHAQYKSDPAAQAMHGAHPLISIWDDHETTNDSWKDGAQNHQPESEGDWDIRRAAALQAYYEWMPVRDPEPGRPFEALFRRYAYGDLVNLVALETRLMARARQFEYSEVVPTLQSPEDIERFRNEVLADPSRQLLGEEQMAFLENAIADDDAQASTWQMVANQIIMAKVIAPDLTPHVSEEQIAELETQWAQARAFVAFSKLGLPVNLDAWDGYPAARERFYNLAKDAGRRDLLVLTGDTHTWWANDLHADDGEKMGVELGVASVTSPSPYDPSFLGGKGSDYALLTTRENDAIRYLSGETHGYIRLSLSQTKGEADYVAVDTIEDRNYSAYVQASFDIEKEDGSLELAASGGLGFKQRVLF